MLFEGGFEFVFELVCRLPRDTTLIRLKRTKVSQDSGELAFAAKELNAPCLKRL